MYFIIRGLSQKVVDFLYNKKNYTVYCNQILLVNSSIIAALPCNFEGKISNNDVCALILLAIGLTHRRTSLELLMTSESLQLLLA